MGQTPRHQNRPPARPRPQRRRPRGMQQLSHAAWQQVRAAIRELAQHPTTHS